MRIVFMGTPSFAVPSLEALIQEGYEVVLALTQPDRPAGRKAVLTPPPVKEFALERGIPTYQPERIRARESREYLAGLAPDLFVTAAFGQILSQRVLDIPKLGTINVHASLLPKYRGSSPINWAIINGETQTGVTTMFTDAGIDTGDMLLSVKTPIECKEDAEALSLRLSALGAGLLIQTLRHLEDGTLERVPQDEAAMSYYPMLTRQMGEMDLSLSCESLHNRVRGLQPWPGAYISTASGPIKVYQARPKKELLGRAGEVLEASPKNGLIIACGSGSLEILQMQAPGGRRMDAKEYLRGKPIEAHSLIQERK